MIQPFHVFKNEFERLVLTLIEKKCSSLLKPFYLRSEAFLHLVYTNYFSEYDAYAPSGIDSDRPTFIHVIESQDISKINQEIEKYSGFVGFPNKELHLIVVPISYHRDEFYSNPFYPPKRVEVWGKEKIDELAREFPVDYASLRYYETVINPKRRIGFGIPREVPSPSVDSFKKNNLDLAKELKNKMAHNKISLVLGSGVSMPYNSKMDWDKLVNSLYDLLDDNYKFSEEGRERAFKLIGFDNLSKSQYVKMMLKDNYIAALYETIYKGFNKKLLTYKTSLYSCAELISKTNSIKKVITYNYDDFLELLLKERNIPFNPMFSINSSLNNDLPIYHVHGYLPKNSEKLSAKEKRARCEELVLTEDEYFKCYSNSMNWQVAIQLMTFKDDCCLLVGNSVTDFHEKKILHETIGLGTNRKSRFAIIPMNDLGENDLLKIYSYFENELGVRIIWADSIVDISNKIDSLA